VESQQAIVADPVPHAGFAQSRHSVCVKQTPRQNTLLAALTIEVYERLLRNLEFVTLPLGYIVHDSSDQKNFLYFITEGIVSKCYLTRSGASAAFAVAGCEGVIGIATFLGGGGIPSLATVVSAGYAYRVRGELMKDEFDNGGPLARVLMRYTQALMAQIGQVAVCNRHHSLRQQMCLRILFFLDRMASNELTMTQELMAEMLGVRREGVTEAAGKLQKAGIIHYSRGHLAVLDRPRLEAEVCECYAVIAREYTRLIPKENGEPSPPSRWWHGGLIQAAAG